MLNRNADFEEVIDMYGLCNIVDTPTCFKSNSPTLIDVAFVNNPRRCNKVITFDCGLSDCHNMVCISTKLHVPPKHRICDNYLLL